MDPIDVGSSAVQSTDPDPDPDPGQSRPAGTAPVQGRVTRSR